MVPLSSRSRHSGNPGLRTLDFRPAEFSGVGAYTPLVDICVIYHQCFDFSTLLGRDAFYLIGVAAARALRRVRGYWGGVPALGPGVFR